MPGLPSVPNSRPRKVFGSARVNLSPDHTHDLFLNLGLLGVDVGISHLAILIPKGICGRMKGKKKTEESDLGDKMVPAGNMLLRSSLRSQFQERVQLRIQLLCRLWTWVAYF